MLSQRSIKQLNHQSKRHRPPLNNKKYVIEMIVFKRVFDDRFDYAKMCDRKHTCIKSKWWFVFFSSMKDPFIPCFWISFSSILQNKTKTFRSLKVRFSFYFIVRNIKCASPSDGTHTNFSLHYKPTANRNHIAMTTASNKSTYFVSLIIILCFSYSYRKTEHRLSRQATNMQRSGLSLWRLSTLHEQILSTNLRIVLKADW